MRDLFGYLDEFYDEDDVTYCIFCDENYPSRQISKHSISRKHLENRVEMLIHRPKGRWCKGEKRECPYLIEEVRKGDLTTTFECGIGFESTFTEDNTLGIELLIGDKTPHPMRPTGCVRSKGVRYERR